MGGQRKVQLETPPLFTRVIPAKRVSGVGLMISEQTFKVLLNWQPVSDRIISTRFSSKVRNITIIQFYAPTELTDDHEKDELYSMEAHLAETS